MKHNVKEITLTGLFAAFTIILAYIEFLIPFNIAIPGAKLGLANIGILITLYYLSVKNAYIVNILRIFIISLFFGNVYTFAFSITGGLLSLTVMALAKRTGKLHIISVSILGGIFHNIGQLTAAYFIILRSSVFLYLPVMLLAGIITGIVIGTVSMTVLGFIDKKHA